MVAIQLIGNTLDVLIKEWNPYFNNVNRVSALHY